MIGALVSIVVGIIGAVVGLIGAVIGIVIGIIVPLVVGVLAPLLVLGVPILVIMAVIKVVNCCVNRDPGRAGRTRAHIMMEINRGLDRMEARLDAVESQSRRGSSRYYTAR